MKRKKNSTRSRVPALQSGILFGLFKPMTLLLRPFSEYLDVFFSSLFLGGIFFLVFHVKLLHPFVVVSFLLVIEWIDMSTPTGR